jgi:hypothetical protein
VATIGTFGKYIRSLLTGWAALMSTVSLALLFLPTTFPDKYRWCIWLAAALCFAGANFMAWKHEYQKAQTVENKLNDIEEAKPKIELRQPNAIYVEPISIEHRISGVPGHWKTVPFVKMRFVNNPKINYPNSVARRVSARVKIFDLSGNCRVDMAGRWDDTMQASAIPLGHSKTELLFVDFGIKQEHGLDIAFRDTDGVFIAWNNDSYDYPDVRKPEYVLPGKEFQVEVKLSAVWVDETFRFQFKGGDNGIAVVT